VDWSVASNVVFDYSGSLDLARKLWRFADDLDTARSTRGADAEGALKSWLGPLATDFSTRIDDEETSLRSAAAAVRSEAGAWGDMWASAVNEQQRINHARECKRIEEDRSTVSKIWGGIVGHDDLPSAPADVSAPSGPGFHVERVFPRRY
jgi:hypothetical protein